MLLLLLTIPNSYFELGTVLTTTNAILALTNNYSEESLGYTKFEAKVFLKHGGDCHSCLQGKSDNHHHVKKTFASSFGYPNDSSE